MSLLAICFSAVAGLIPGTLSGQSNDPANSDEEFTMFPRPPRWSLSAGGTAIKVSDLNGWGFGPSVFVNWNFNTYLGAEFGPTIVLESEGFYRFGGLSADLGAVYTWSISDLDLSLSAGPSMIAGSDSDGTFLALGGGYVAARGTYWTGNDWFGLFVRGSLRLWHTGDLGPAGTVGVSVEL